MLSYQSKNQEPNFVPAVVKIKNHIIHPAIGGLMDTHGK